MKKALILMPILIAFLVFESSAKAAVPIDAVETLNASGTNPNLLCYRLNYPQVLEFETGLDESGPCSLYIVGAEASSPDEQLICSIGSDPEDVSKIKSASWDYIQPDVSQNNIIQVSAVTETPGTALALVVCQNGTYTIAGPILTNQDSPCSFCPQTKEVPTVTHWGMLVLAVLLTGPAIWFMRPHWKRN